MPFYHRLGEMPRMKHTTFYQPDGRTLYREELVSSKGFSGVYSNKYHYHLPTALTSSRPLDIARDISWPEAEPLYYHFSTDKEPTGGDFIRSRTVYLRNARCSIATAHVTEPTDDFYRNSSSWEYIFVHHGKGELLSDFGRILFAPGDQLIIPRCTTYWLRFDSYDDTNKLLIVESDTAFEIPRHFRNDFGQLEEHAPYSERNFKLPEFIEPQNKKGAFRLILKAGERFYEHIIPHHPFDVVGWDGYLYPYAFNIRDYHAKVGRIHLPPPIHLAFTTESFVLCNFVPRPFDFHKDAVPAPYFHFNIDSDEVLYYVEGDFMSRKGVKEGSITLHPGGMPHGPQPGKTEDSVGVEATEEYAVMIDTFGPLKVTTNVRDRLDKNYAQSWLE